MQLPKIVLTDPDLFGNDVAEDEDEEVFSSYVLERPETKEFLSKSYRILVARAYKGEGKSSLLRYLKKQIETGGEEVVIQANGTMLSPDISTEDSAVWIRHWKTSIFKLIANEIGAKLGFAWNDDSISLVEEAEQNGFRSRSFFSAVFDRFKFGKLPQTSRIGVVDPERLVQRWIEGRAVIWLLIDDVDQNFQNTPHNKLKISSFFTACREISGLVPEVRFRLTVKPNVWTTIKSEYESLSHVEQYMRDLDWTDDTILFMLSKRIEAYLVRTGQAGYLSTLTTTSFIREKKIVSLVFDEKMDWNWSKRDPHLVISTLSRQRPRWVIELCKASARATKKSRVSLDDINSQLDSFGRKRIADTIAEFRSQCPQVEDIIAAFSKNKVEYSTEDLISFIGSEVLPGLTSGIVGVIGEPDERDVASFLFQIGFISGRHEYASGAYEPITYTQQPSLFRVKTNFDDGLSWEIHPVFKQVLRLQGGSRYGYPMGGSRR